MWPPLRPGRLTRAPRPPAPQYDGGFAFGGLGSSLALDRCAALFPQPCALAEHEAARDCLAGALSWAQGANTSSLADWYQLPAALRAANASFAAGCELGTAVGRGTECGPGSSPGDTCWLLTVATSRSALQRTCAGTDGVAT